MPTPKQVRERMDAIIPMKSQKILMIETLLGTGYVLANFIKDNIETEKLTLDAAYAISIIMSNLMCLAARIGDEVTYQAIDLSQEEDIRKKIAMSAKSLYDYCLKEGLIDGV